MNEMLQLLASHPIFNKLNDEELQSLLAIIERSTVEEGFVIFDPNEEPEYMYYIENGSFILSLKNNEYKTLHPGQLIGEIGVLNKDFRSGVVYAAETSTVISISGTKLFDEAYIPTKLALKIVRALAQQITNYLRSREEVSTLEIIQQGEDDNVEFKSTLRWNLHSQKKDKTIEKAALKTMAAFMNSEGGILIVGVADDGTLLGLENDRFANSDKMLLHLTNIIKDRIGPLHMKFLNFSIEKVLGKEVLRIDCEPASSPVYFRDDNLDHLFIRSGPSTTDLRLSKVYRFIKERFPK